MNASIRGQLFTWLFGAILVAGVLAASLSFMLSYQDANELQDRELEQVAAMLARVSPLPQSATFHARSDEDAEAHFVIRPLGLPAGGSDPAADPHFAATLSAGLQTLAQSGERWRAIVSTSADGQRFAVAQRMTVRDEVARNSAMLALLPALALIPILLTIIGLVLRKAFAPMRSLSQEVDRLKGDRLTALDERGVPLEALSLVQAFNRLMGRLGTTLEQQRRLVADAAHELRTPVATLIIQADNVQHVELPTEARSRMQTLRQGLTQMATLMDQLLSFARLQGAAPAPRQRIDFAALVRSAIEEVLPMAQAKDVDLGCLWLDVTTAIEGDPLQAFALVRNVIDNAVRYTPSGGAVDVSVALENGNALLIVEDTGPGIGPDDIDRVFEPFVRILGSKESGSGLGLAIVRAAAQGLGGYVELVSRIDHRPGLRLIYRQPAV